jgi:hypothetical protein
MSEVVCLGCLSLCQYTSVIVCWVIFFYRMMLIHSFNARAGIDHSLLTVYTALVIWGFEYLDITAEGKFELLCKTMCVIFLTYIQPTRCHFSQFIYFSNALHVLDGTSTHHQELRLCIQLPVFLKPCCYLLRSWLGWNWSECPVASVLHLQQGTQTSV